ncbi:MAG: hypothetical protein JW778_03365 [Candidatus Altiarchaeota archaeon]|nr:hypothetical protein [Candidatus Altiarchaeota archaeon]
MENSTERIIRLLLTHPKRRWVQKDLAEKTHCSTAFVSKLMKKFQSENIIARPYKNQVVLIGFSKLLNRWSSTRKLPQPIYIRTSFSEEKIEGLLRREKGYVLTLFRAAWHRTKFMKTDSFEVYVVSDKIEGFTKKLGARTENPTNFIVYECEEQVFEGMETINKLRLVSVVQNYTDLMSLGGTGSRVAFNLAEKYGLIG